MQWFQRMDLNARIDVNFARVDVNFQMFTVTSFCHNFFFLFDTNQHQGPTHTQNKISAKYTEPFWRSGLKCQGQRKFSNGHCDLIPLQIFFHFDINQHQGPTNTSYKRSY